MHYPQPQREPNGCIQTLIISRIIMGMLLIPMAMIIGAIVAIILTFYALTVHPLLALLVIAVCVSLIVGFAKWEGRRIAKQYPKDD